MPTDQRFTGQKTDGSGLMYYNSRYFDPEIGQFISPDSVVPDPTNVMDYNRYMYVRGHAMNANDPTGHCIAQGQTGSNSASNAQCNFYAFQIAQLGGLDYIHEHFGGGWNSVDEWLKIAQSDPNLGLDFMKQYGDPLYQDWCMSAGIGGQAGCGGAYYDYNRS